jgi:Carboxypeptidase regulatory-like domain
MCTSRTRVMLPGLFMIALGAARPASAQDTGTIAGTIIDQSGQVLPGVTVTLTNERTADSRTPVTDERGEFAFRAVPPGLYTVRTELAGFRSFEQRNNVLNASAILSLGSPKMEIGVLSEVVSVGVLRSGPIPRAPEADARLRSPLPVVRAIRAGRRSGRELRSGTL